MTRLRDVGVYPASYREKEMRRLAAWILAGESGAVVGLSGCGRSNLLHFLCHRPDVLRTYLPSKAGPVALIPVDLNHLPVNDSATLYRVLLRAFYWVRHRFQPPLNETIASFYLDNRATQDAFLAQGALHELLFAFRSEQTQVVLVLNHFDRFCHAATPPMFNSLRGLRDSFKETLCFIVGTAQEIAYLPDPEGMNNMLYSHLNRRTCWVGAMTEDDARYVIRQATYTASPQPSKEEIRTMLALTGRFPALLKAVGHWQLNQSDKLPPDKWLTILTVERPFDDLLKKIWESLTDEEQFVLAGVQQWQTDLAAGKVEKSALEADLRRLNEAHTPTLHRLVDKGVCRPTPDHPFTLTGWQIRGRLLADYINRVGPAVRGKLRFDQKTGEIYQGLTSLREALTPKEYQLLHFLLQHPYQPHTKSSLINEAWSEEEIYDKGITDTNLHRLAADLRKKIEKDKSQPHYLITCKHVPDELEGGYQLYPEGRPAQNPG